MFDTPSTTPTLVLATDPTQKVKIGFCQHPFVQNVLPILTSLLTHGTIVLLGILTYQVIRISVRNSSTITGGENSIVPIISPTSPILHGRGGIGTDETNLPRQIQYPDVKTNGWAQSPGEDPSKWLNPPGGGSGDEAKAGTIGIGSDKSFGKGVHGLGVGTGEGVGSGDGGGMLAPFGPVRYDGAPCHGEPSPVFTPVAGMRRVVYICDATGSMMSQFDNLRIEVRRAIELLRPTQAFNVIFFQENAPPPADSHLLAAVPSCKKRVYDYVDGVTARGPTDPVPAIRAAFAMKPDVIYFLCDPSDFPDPKGAIALFKALNGDRKCKVNTIAFMEHDQQGEAMLREIAGDSGGKFKYVDENDMGK